MCGIAGVARRSSRPIDPAMLRRMATAIQHRGPDDWGVRVDDRVGFAHRRLSIIDLAGGVQPLSSDDDLTVITYNGEVFNYIELRDELRALGRRFRTTSDTEVLVRAYEQWGVDMLPRLNGQFAFAIHDRRRNRVLLARDRFGVRPLFWAERGGDLYFASEAKALFASGEVDAGIDPVGLDGVFTLWGTRAPRTPFRGVQQLEPGCWMSWEPAGLRHGRFWSLAYDAAAVEPRDAIEQLDALMHSSVELRLRADVPVGAYLSGGLDSSITSALAARTSPYTLRTFSLSFADPRFDESEFQQLVARQLNTQHHVVRIDAADIADAFPDVVWHTETPLVRTAPAPMYLLARQVREAGIKVVLTGEGADELFLGYDLFKETAVRLFCLRHPASKMRPRLFDRLYPYLTQGGAGGEFWRRFFLDAGPAADPLFSHLPRIRITSRIKDFYSPELRSTLADTDPLRELRDLVCQAGEMEPLNRAAWLECTTLLASYLLNSQGDRMAMAHGVEGRFPFLDHRVFTFAAALPTSSKLLGLREKEILKRWAKDVVPPAVRERTKQPYRAPDAAAFFAAKRPEYVDELLSPDAIRSTGLFDPRAVAGLVRRCEAGRATGFAENQALVAILSSQLWHRAFLGPHTAAPSASSAAPAGSAPALTALQPST